MTVSYFSKWVGSLCWLPGRHAGLGDLISKHSHQTLNCIRGQKSNNYSLSCPSAFFPWASLRKNVSIALILIPSLESGAHIVLLPQHSRPWGLKYEQEQVLLFSHWLLWSDGKLRHWKSEKNKSIVQSWETGVVRVVYNSIYSLQHLKRRVSRVTPLPPCTEKMEQRTQNRAFRSNLTTWLKRGVFACKHEVH